MTDEQLITMLYESSPADLSAAQLKVLRTRMLASSRVKQAVAHRVRLEQALTETLDTPHLKTAAVVAACTAAAVAVPIAGGLLGWFKGWGLTVWSSIAAVTVSVPVAVVMMLPDPPQPDGPLVAPAPSASMITRLPLPPGEDLEALDDSPSNNLPDNWVPYSGVAEPLDPQAAENAQDGDTDATAEGGKR